MKKTKYKYRLRALKEWKNEAKIQGMPKTVIKRVEDDFNSKNELIKKWEEEADYFASLGEMEEKDLALDEAHEIHNTLLDLLNIKKFAA